MIKQLLIIAIFIGSFGVNAQIDPTFEKEGDKIKATYFHANGEIAQQGYFMNEKLQGEWKMFNEQGNMVAVGNYQEGVKTGKWTFWEADVEKEVSFDNNRIASVINAETKEPIVIN